MMPESTPGCAGLISMILAALMGIFAGTTASAPNLATPIPTPDLAAPSLQIVFAAQGQPTTAQLNEALNVLNRRLTALQSTNQIGRYTLSLEAEGRYTLLLGPGSLDTESVLKALIVSGALEFVDFRDAPNNLIGQNILTSDGIARTGEAANGRTIYRTVITAAEIASAEANLSPQSGNWQVSITMTAEGAQKLAAHTKANIGQALAIVLDGLVVSAPTIQAEVSKAVVIAGRFTQREAETLAIQVNSKPLPVKLVLQSIDQIK